MKHVITLIVYRPNHDDYCRGCHMSSTRSDLELYVGEADEVELPLLVIKQWAVALRANEERQTEYADYECTLLIDGRRREDCDDEDILEQFSNLEEELLASVQARRAELAREEAERQAQALRVEDEKKRRQMEQVRQAQEEKDKKDWERLNAKYGNQGVA